jgi:deubiquitinase DESI2
LLHSGIVVNGREYAYGGHDRKNVSGVYWTRPKLEPPGGTWRCELLQGFSFLTRAEIDDVIHEASQRFQGTSYNLLTNNCNHFTNYLCEKLTSKPAPAWLNRAAGIGVALPCVVPKEWVAPPDHETADGELLEDDSDDDDERVSMLKAEQRRQKRERAEERRGREVPDDEQDRWDEEMDRISKSSSSRTASVDQAQQQPKTQTRLSRLIKKRDSDGRTLPASERAPIS